MLHLESKVPKSKVFLIDLRLFEKLKMNISKSTKIHHVVCTVNLVMDKRFKNRNNTQFIAHKTARPFAFGKKPVTIQYHSISDYFIVKCFSSVNAVQISKIFPPKDLEKYGRSKYACAVFFFKKATC